jgi:hypothetical protein
VTFNHLVSENSLPNTHPKTNIKMQKFEIKFPNINGHFDKINIIDQFVNDINLPSLQETLIILE